MGVALTERDKQLIREIAKYGIITMEYAGQIYGTNEYHKKRVSKLVEEKYIKRSRNQIWLWKKGKELLEQEGIEYKEPPTDKRQREKVKNVVDLMHKLSTWEQWTSWQLKNNEGYEKNAMFYGMLQDKKTGQRYMLYFITKRLSKMKMQQIKREIKGLQAYGIDRVIIFIENKETMQKFNPESITGLQEQIIMPYNALGISLIKTLGEENINEKAAKIVYGEGIEKSPWKQADYKAGDKYIFVMILNDIEKIDRLKIYSQIAEDENLKNIEILCLEEQQKMMQEQFSNITIKTVRLQDIIN